MPLKIHHLNCGTLCPVCRRLINGDGGWLEAGRLVCHCLLIETKDTLILVDTGFGSDDIREPGRRLGLTGKLLRPALNPSETARAQAKALGYQTRDVRHIITTHLDLDHAGGLADFPEADVHLLSTELEAAQKPSWRERARYRAPQFAHRPRWRPHAADSSEDWFGFRAQPIIPGLDDELLLVALPGHSRGHAGVAVKHGGRWLLHAGDAFFHRASLSDPAQIPPGSALVERADEIDRAARLHTAARLRRLAIDHADEVTVFCSHDPEQLRALAGI